MKFLTAISILFLLVSCKKDKPCPTCQLTLINGRGDYSYTVTIGNTQTPFTLQPAEVKTVPIDASSPVSIHGKLNTLFAGDDFYHSVWCDGDCGPILVTMKHQ